jgi:hypothetical protein
MQSPGNMDQLPGNTDRLPGKTKPESGRTESQPGKTEPRSGKEKPVLGNTNQLRVTKTDYREKQIQKQNRARVIDAGYGKSWNQFRVKKTMKNRLLRTASPGTMDHL